jgi:methionyl-tRNA formyltransferase
VRVAIAGTGTLGVNVMIGVVDAGHEIVALLQDGRKVKGFRRWLGPFLAGMFGAATTVTGYAKRHGIPIFYIDKMDETELRPLRDLNIDLLLVAGFAIILKQPLIDLPKIGAVNCHPSLLPLHRGPNPFAAVILAQREETGVSFHVMEATIDTGDILLQERIELEGTESAGEVYRKTSALAGEMIEPLLEHLAAEGLQGTPQDNTNASYEGKFEGDRLFIDWAQSAEDIHRHCRAALPFAFPRFRDGSRIVYVTKTTCDTEPVDAAPGTVLEVRPTVERTTKTGKVIRAKAQARIATGAGSVMLWGALSMKPIPGLWPGVIFERRNPGHVVE